MDVLCQLLWNPAKETAWSRVRRLDPEPAAKMFVLSAFMGSVCEALIERHYVLHHRNEKVRDLDEAFAQELRPVAELQEILSTLLPDDLGFLEINSERITSLMVLMATHETPEYLRAFAGQAVKDMAEICKPPFGLLQNSLYRTFDVLDELFGLDYSGDKAMDCTAREGERIYAGAGQGVQSSYLSLFTVLRQLPEGPTRIVDLGSGYGRIGLVAGLLNPAWSVVGYEYVQHRVEVAQASASRLGLSPRIVFVTQDLSDPTFQIPGAEVFYMYDPFNQKTYDRVLSQITGMKPGKQLQIITKGSALHHFQHIVQSSPDWQPPVILDEANLAVFAKVPGSPAAKT
jgi:hypothetical protein